MLRKSRLVLIQCDHSGIHCVRQKNWDTAPLRCPLTLPTSNSMVARLTPHPTQNVLPNSTLLALVERACSILFAHDYWTGCSGGRCGGNCRGCSVALE